MAYFNSIQPFANTLKSAFKQAIPNRCAVCDGFCNELVCQRCYISFEPNWRCCAVCAEPLPTDSHSRGEVQSNQKICGQCLSSPPLYRKAISPFLYSSNIRKLILQFKFTGNLSLASFFAIELASSLNNQFTSKGCPDAIVPIPLHPTRLKQRGYNQAQLLGKALANELNIPLDNHCLKRTKLAKPQAGLSKSQRASNIKGAFTLANQIHNNAAYQHILVIDDVITTGATTHEACKALTPLHSGLSITLCSIARSAAFS